MDALAQQFPWLIAMAMLIVGSGFFSASEAALFSLKPTDRRSLQTGNTAQRSAARLLDDSERLLSAVLFWNLTINIAYFSIVSIVNLRLEESDYFGQSTAIAFGVASLLAIIFCSEMIPKSVAVLRPRALAAWVAVPLVVAVRLVDPIMPALQVANVLSRRLIWPNFKPEKYLEVVDLERAIELSTTDANLIEQEQAALRNIVLLSDIRAEEWMRPRSQFQAFRPPVMLADLKGTMTPSGYLLITEPDSEEVDAAIHLKEMADVPAEHLEHYAEPVVQLPWCATVADALQKLAQRHRQVAAIVNEFGETIGILTLEDILDTVFTYHPSRSRLLLGKKPIHDISENVWLAAGVTSLRRLSRYLEIELPPSKCVTLAGVIQQALGRIVTEGDICDWGPFHMKVLEAPERGHMLIELTRTKRVEADQ
jgi:CBS domain containing-hemolysin-like protein